MIATPDISRDGTINALDHAVELLSKRSESPYLGGSAPCTPLPGDPREVVDPAPRLILVLDETDRHIISVRGQRNDIRLRPGQVVYFPPHAWTIPFMDNRCRFLGLVFRSPWYIRIIQFTLPGRPIYRATPSAYHTAGPVTGPAAQVMAALNELAEEGNAAPPARELVISLLHLVRRQVVADVPGEQPRAISTWRSIEAHLAGHYGKEVTRESVADAFGLHPNYVSALARQVSGRSFRESLEGIRMQEARRLLRATDLKLARIADLCGFTEITHFAKAFRRVAGMTPGRFRTGGSV